MSVFYVKDTHKSFMLNLVCFISSIYPRKYNKNMYM